MERLSRHGRLQELENGELQLQMSKIRALLMGNQCGTTGRLNIGSETPRTWEATLQLPQQMD
jgi:hypothetical protein